MAQDDLHRPLGQPPEDADRAKTRISARAIVLGLFGLTVVSGGAYLWATDDGNGGRAIAIAKIERPADKPQVPTAAVPGGTDRTPTGTIAGINGGAKPPRSSVTDIERGSGVRVVRRGGGRAPGALIISIPDTPQVSLVPAPDRRLVQRSRYGILPKTGKGGAKPLEVYARPLIVSGKVRPGAPRVAILVGGMGLSYPATGLAIQVLPPAVSLAFAPYGKGLEKQVANARAEGHEVFLQVPMEPFNLIGPGPGPKLLKVQYDRKQMRERLYWHMGRFTGYVGIANFLGGKFTADANALAPVMENIRARGLLYFDDGTSPRSLSRSIAAKINAPFVGSDILIDEKRTASGVDAALLKLEAMAVRRGFAVGFANGLPMVVRRIGRFARSLEKRGVALVPVSAMLGKYRSAQANNR